MQRSAELPAPEIASFLAGKAIAAATAYLQGRSEIAELARSADQLRAELLLLAGDPACNAIADPTRLLVEAMGRTAVSNSPLTQDWCLIMFAFVGLLRRQLRELAPARELAVTAGRA